MQSDHAQLPLSRYASQEQEHGCGEYAMQITSRWADGQSHKWGGGNQSATITTYDVAVASAVAIVVVTSAAAAVAAAYWSTPRRRFDPAGYSCNLFQFVWTAKLVSHRVHALQSTAHNTRPSSFAPSLCYPAEAAPLHC